MRSRTSNSASPARSRSCSSRWCSSSRSFSSASSSGWFITSEREREADRSRPDARASRTSGASPMSASSLTASAVTIQRQRRPLPLRRAGSYVLLAVVSVLVTFLLRQAFLQIPREMWDAARIDGATTFRFLREVVIPLSRPALGTVAIYGFLSTYNQYFWPLLITNETLMRTTQVGIAQLRFEESLRWGLVMAGVIMVAVPTLALLVLGQRQLIRGLTAGAVKG